ncbi:hypothetical protein NC652_015110 [Populus alba x Populus x berolinensis]|nr:hypothetical protein NC652_015110 [Populus alba x Populus x berolinensis]
MFDLITLKHDTQERNAKDVEIPNIRWDVFELMMRFIYTGSVEVNINIAQDLLRAADQYLLDGLKRLCECTIAQDIFCENVSLMHELSEGFNAMSLREHAFCSYWNNSTSYVPSHVSSFPTNKAIFFERLMGRFDCETCRSSSLIQRIMPEIRNYFEKALSKPTN